MPEAVVELEEARSWYADIRPALGLRFARMMEQTVAVVSKQPLRFPEVYRGRRRANVPYFPYGIFFEVSDDHILVIACFHASRDPKRWQSR